MQDGPMVNHKKEGVWKGEYVKKNIVLKRPMKIIH